MKICPECGRPYDDAHAFCGNCGVALEAMVTEYRTCPKCGSHYTPEHLYCGECGTLLEPPDDATA